MSAPIETCPSCGGEAPDLRFCDLCGRPMSGVRAGDEMPSVDETVAAAGDAGRCLLVARRFAEAGRLGEFMREHAARSAPFYDAYARAFLRLGQFRAAMALVGAKSPPDLKDRDLRMILADAVRELEASGLFKGAHEHRARLGAAVRLSERGFKPEALALVDEALVAAAALDDVESLQVARVFKDAARTGEFMARWAPGRDGAFYSAYGRAFFTLEAFEEALQLLGRKSALAPDDYPALVGSRKALGRLAQAPAVPEAQRLAYAQALMDAGEDKLALAALVEGRSAPLGHAEYACGLRLCLRLADGDAAEALFERFSCEYSLSRAPELYYAFALGCEKRGSLEKAKEIYRELGEYKDAQDRLKNIETMSLEEATRLGAAVIASTRPLGWELSAGELIGGRFEVRGPLGLGGMGVVFKGFDRVLPRLVAIKQLRQYLALDADSRRGLIEEARTVAALSHPYIVAIHDIVALEREVFLIFEFVEGETLHDVLASRGRLAAAECARVLRDVCEALQYAHEKGVVHRDLKPANVMLTRHGHVKVMDFGIAKQLQAPAAGGRPAADPLGTGFEIGTPLYMAPEQHAGRATPLSDVYALGAMALELLTGERPFPGPDFVAQKLRERYTPLGDDVPGPLRELVAQCLKPDPEARPQGMAAIRERL